MTPMHWLRLALTVYLGVHYGYVLVMAAKAAYERGELTHYWIVILFPAIVTAWVLDVVFQFTFGWLMFLETPFRGGWFFSNRVQHHYRSSSGWRNRLARFWARNLNVFDKEHIH